MDYELTPKTRLVAERQEPTFYAMIPKIAQMELDPYELALYCNIKQTIAEDPNKASWKSNATLAKETKMSIRKVIYARDSLIDKGYIQVAYMTNENGKIVSSAIVTVVDVWERNHKTYAKSKQKGYAPDAQGYAPHAIPHAHDATKEESINKNENNKQKDSSVEKSTDTELETMISLVKKELKQYSNTEMIAKALLGRLKGKQAKHNLDTAITDKELLEFVAWWDLKKDRNGMSLTRPKNLGSLKSNIQAWLDTRVVKTSAAPAMMHSDSQLQDRILDLMGE